MNKNYIYGLVIGLIFIALFSWFLCWTDKNQEQKANSMIPNIGQKLWTYNMNEHAWKSYSDSDSDTSKQIIILQVQEPENNGGYTSYHLITGNAQVPKEDVWIGEGSEEFLSGKKLFSYYPKTFEFYEVLFNGVQFVPRKLSIEEVRSLFKDYQIIRVSQLKKGEVKLKFTKRYNKYLIYNDGDSDFYKYYIVPNNSKKLEIGKFSNQFNVNGSVEIKIQRLEGCSKAYPCYSINIV